MKFALPELDEKSIRHIKVGAFDLDGVLRGKYIGIDKLATATDPGLGFCDVIFGWDIGDVLYDNVKLTGWHTGYPDAVAKVDLESRRMIPWEPGTALFLMDLFDKQGEPLAVAPRQLFRRVLKEAESRGYQAYFGAEYEFWFFQETSASLREKGFRDLKPLTPGMFGYSVLRASASTPLVLDVMDQLSAFGIPLECFHTETGPGVYEAAISATEGLEAADRAALFKTALKEIGLRHGVIPTFMAKWNGGLPGSSGHLHQSLWDPGLTTNLFHRGDVMRQYIAGLVKHLPELMVMVCPTVNSYKRTVPGTWAPVNSTWGTDNRTTAIRAIPGTPTSSRVELRLSGADINPYLAMAASLAAGLDGIEHGLEPQPETRNAYESANAPALPRNLGEATQRFRESAIARKWFGNEFVDHYAATREWEVRQYEKAVTDWELERYFESI